MPKDAAPQPDVAPAKASAVGQHPRVLLLFVLVAVVSLVADLGLKSWSFANIADAPLRVEASDVGPRIYAPVDAGQWSLLPRLDPKHAASAIPAHQPLAAVPVLLNMELMLNEGAVFGMGKGQRWLFIIVSVIATAVILTLLWRSPAKAYGYQIALALILSGALGNLYDRVRFGAVRDMLHLLPDMRLPFGLNWPGGGDGLYPWIFNIADVALVVGVLMVLVISWRNDKQQPRQSSR